MGRRRRLIEESAPIASPPEAEAERAPMTADALVAPAIRHQADELAAPLPPNPFESVKAENGATTPSTASASADPGSPAPSADAFRGRAGSAPAPGTSSSTPAGSCGPAPAAG